MSKRLHSCGKHFQGLKKHLHGLRAEMLLLLLMSVGFGIGCFFGIRALGNLLVNNILKTSGYIEREEQLSANSLQTFVSVYGVNATDEELLDQWTEAQGAVYIAVIRDGFLLYDSTYAIQAGQELSGSYGTEHVYSVAFSDGPADVYLIGFYAYRYSNVILIASIAGAFILTLMFFMIFLQRKINYIKQLEKEIKILETGGLNHPVTVRGRDELASLAEGLNEMRTSLSNNLEMVSELSSANTNLVTELSHDLRTPLTALLLYLELLRKGKYRDAETQQKYLEKASLKGNEVKSMSDDLFERFLISGEKEAHLEEPEEIRYIFEDSLSDLMIFLESQGFSVDCTSEWPKGKLAVSTDYITRIFNNISSNIQKYADKNQEILIRLRTGDGKVCLSFANGKKGQADHSDSTKIGLPNIRLMMRKMNGDCGVEEDGENFRISLFFLSVAGE